MVFYDPLDIALKIYISLPPPSLTKRRSPCRAQTVGVRTKITLLQFKSLSLLIARQVLSDLMTISSGSQKAKPYKS